MKPDLGQKLNKKILLFKKELETNLFAYHAKITKWINVFQICLGMWKSRGFLTL